MKTYKFVRIDNMSAVRDNSLMRSAKYFKDGVEADVENGTIVEVKTLLSGEREIHEAVPVTEESVEVGLVTTPELEHDERGYHDIETFINKAGEPIRIHLFHAGDTFSIGNSKDKEDIALGKHLVAKHIETEINGRYEYQCFRVYAL